jgi:hypothetical protein
MQKFRLIYFIGCPNYEPAKSLLEKAGVEFEEVCQDEISSSDPHKEFSSPTLLMDDRIIFGSRVSGSGGGCLWKLPTIDELVEAIKSA